MAMTDMNCLASGGGATCDELWTNTTYPTAQGEITISEDISSYDGILVDVIWGDGDPVTVTAYHEFMYFPKDRWSYSYNRIFAYNNFRNITISSSSIVISGLGGAATASNRVVPVAIYGVKGLTIDA